MIRHSEAIGKIAVAENCIDRDRGEPYGPAPPTPPGIRVTYHGGSIGLNLGGDMESGKTEGVEVMVAQGLLDRRVS